MTRSLLRPGVYPLRVVAVSLRQTKNRYPVWRVYLVAEEHNSMELYWFACNAPGAEFTWRELTTKFNEVPSLILGRVFLFRVKIDTYNGIPRNMVNPPLAEVTGCH